MKAFFLSLALITSFTATAGNVKELVIRTNEEIEAYYKADGDWAVESIENLNFQKAPESEIHVSADVKLSSVHSGKEKKEKCIVAFDKSDLELIGLECF